MSIENNEFTDVMDEISVKNSLISHLERENDELKAELKDMKYYSSEYEKKAKAELKTANDGIDDLNDVLKDMQKESIEQIESNIGLQAECDDLRKACKLLKEDKAIQYLKADNKKRLNDLKLND